MHYFFVKFLSGRQDLLLKIGTSGIGGQGQDNHPFPFYKKWHHTIASHVGIDGDRITTHFFKYCPGIHVGRISNISTFRIRDNQMFIANVRNRLFQDTPSFDTHGFIEGKVGLICYADMTCSVNDRFIKCEHITGNGCRQFRRICIQSNGEYGTLSADEIAKPTFVFDHLRH